MLLFMVGKRGGACFPLGREKTDNPSCKQIRRDIHILLTYKTGTRKGGRKEEMEWKRMREKVWITIKE